MSAQAAYGVRISFPEPTPWFSVRGGDHWPLLEIESGDVAEPIVNTETLTATVPAATRVSELVHPILSSLAAPVALARGLDLLHAGGICLDGGVWAVVGPREAGKTTLLAASAEGGLPVFTDDVLVYDGRRAYAGPRCLDLREEAAGRFEGTQPVRPLTPRHRLTLDPIDAELPLAGFIHLAWGEQLTLERLTVTEALARLVSSYNSGGATENRPRLLDLAGLPSYELRRPRDLAVLGEVVGLLRSEVARGTLA